MLFQFSNKSLFVIADVLNSNRIPPIVLMSIFFGGWCMWMGCCLRYFFSSTYM